MSNLKVEVMGSMTGNDSDSDRDASDLSYESDIDDHRRDAEYNAIDDDGELEVFTSTQENDVNVHPFVQSENHAFGDISEFTSSPPKVASSAPSGLLAAMAASIKEVENRKIKEVDKYDDSVDTFGIKYVPYLKDKAAEDRSKSNAVDDEHEYEKITQSDSWKSLISFKAKDGDDNAAEEEDDDEFDVDNTNTSNLDSVREAILRASSRGQETIDPIESSKSDGANDELQEGVNAVQTESIDQKVDIFASARNAFNEISSIYGSGLGDQEVLISELSEEERTISSIKKSAKAPFLSSTDRTTYTIQEGSEEEEEEEEEGQKVGEEERGNMIAEFNSKHTEIITSTSGLNSEEYAIESFGLDSSIALNEFKETAPLTDSDILISKDARAGVAVAPISYVDAEAYLR